MKVVQLSSYLIVLVLLVAILKFGLLPALMAGLVVYSLEKILTPFISANIIDKKSQLLALSFLAILIISILSAATFYIVVFLSGDGSLANLFSKMAEGVSLARKNLPIWIKDFIPSDIETLRHELENILREHADIVPKIGQEAIRFFLYSIIGMAIGGLIAIRPHSSDIEENLASANTDANNQPIIVAKVNNKEKLLSGYLSDRIFNLSISFRRVIFAQVQISLINTILTTVYLYIVLPLFDIYLPLRSTLVAVTFLAGLLPIVGNIISNTVTTLVSFHYSPMVAVISLGYLVVIHKLEYFINAKIIGHNVNAKAWELLCAMLLMEAIFGLPGLIIAPVCYAWLKEELKLAKLL